VSDRIDVTATIRATDQASATIQAIERSLGGLTRAAESVGQAFRHISHAGAFGGLAHNIQHLGGALGHVKHGFEAILEPLAAIAGIAGGFSVEQSLESYIGDAEHLARMSQTLGTTADQLGAYEFAAKKAGVETENFDKSMQFAQRNMRKGALGLDPKQAGLFKKMGIDLGAFRNGTKSAFDYLPQLADAMKAQHTSAARAAIAFAVFGRAGGAMIPFLLQGSKAVREQAKEYLAQDHITQESAKAAVEFAHKQHDLARTFTSLRDAVGNAVTPTLIHAMERFQEAFAKNRPGIVKALTEAVGGLADSLDKLNWDEVLKGIGDFWSGVQTAVGWIGGWRNALIALVVYINGPLIVAVLEVGLMFGKLALIMGQGMVSAVARLSSTLIRFTAWLTTGFVRGLLLATRGLAGLSVALSRGLVTALAAAGRAVLAFGAMLLTTPLGWILAAIAAIAFAAYEIYENWDTIGPWFWRQWDTVKQAFSATWAWIKSWIPQFVPDAIQAAWEFLGPWFTGLWSVVKQAFSEAWTWVQSWFTQFLPDAIMAVWGALGPWFISAWDVVRAAFTSAATWLASWIPQFVPDTLKDIWNSLGAAFQLIWDTVHTVFTGVTTWFGSWLPQFIPDGVKQAWSGLTGFFKDLWSGITDIFDAAWAKIRPIVDALSAFARGVGGAVSGALNAVGLGSGPTPATAGPGGGAAPPPGSLLATPSGAPGAPGASGSVKVDVNIGGNVPPGTTASTAATGSVKPDVGVSMPVLPY
jgi:phage-related minor tail protein